MTVTQVTKTLILLHSGMCEVHPVKSKLEFCFLCMAYLFDFCPAFHTEEDI